MTLDHVSNCRRPPAATPSAATLGGQPWLGLAPPPSWTALGLSACPSQGAFSFFADQSTTLSEQIAAWPQSEMSFTPTSGSGLPPRSSGDYCFGFPQSASGSELAPLPPSLRIPSLEEASTHNMVSAMGRAMPCHRGDLSINLGSSISSVPNLTTGAMKSPSRPPLKPPSSQGAGTSSNFINFATRPSSNSELAPLPESLLAPLLPEKQSPIDATGARHDPDFKSFIDNDGYELDQDDPTARDMSWETALKPSEDTRITRSKPFHHGSSSMGIENSRSTPKVLQSLPPSSLRAVASRSRSPVTRVIYTDAEKEIIRKDKNLQELVNTDPKRVKRLLSNRISAAKRKAINDIHTLELELKVEALQSKYNTSFAESQLLQEQCAELDTQNKEMSMVIQELKRQAMLKDAVTETLQAKIQALNVMKLNAAQMRSKKNKCPGCSCLTPTK
ncbi:hypothetical protein PAHAL_6G065500 [Panicum hallii]|uniref:BZIP domain-containing protein n=1 Tax=Panicum hallii TaxID=206008 RepID=A0A2T8IFE4_9POAL|nr:hypothetical protein PAHAL_6G065500 [Panicum hallii]